MRQFYQHYFTATAKLCWLRWLSVPQRLTMLEGLMQWLMWNGKKGSPPTHTHPTPTVDSLVTRNGPRNKNQTNQRSPDDSP